MVAENIRDLLRREPFVPFRLVPTSGGHYDVVNPELAVVLKSEVFIAFADGERWAHVPLLHIASLETIRDGRSRRPGRRRRQ
jgi:hypothetical protein